MTGYGISNESQWHIGKYLRIVKQEEVVRDFPGGPVVKTSPSNSGGAGLIPGWGTGIPHASRPKSQNIK